MLAVKDVYEKKFESVPLETTMREVAGIMASKKTGHILVKNASGELIGIVTESDFVRKVTAMDLVPYVTKVSDVMSSPLIDIDINANTSQAQELMDRHRVLHLAVRDDGNVVGMVSVRDLIHDFESPENGGKYWAG
ncbi:MAG: cyclic nucleotide-binding/CBS domain-containing protein [Leptospirillia bacterium]